MEMQIQSLNLLRNISKRWVPLEHPTFSDKVDFHQLVGYKMYGIYTRSPDFWVFFPFEALRCFYGPYLLYSKHLFIFAYEGTNISSKIEQYYAW